MKKYFVLFFTLLSILTFSSCSTYNFENVDTIDNNNRVMYQIFVGSFSDSNNDGIGDINGITNRIDYLNDGNTESGKSLGVQGLWLSPIFESNSYHKYDAIDYYTIDPKFGTIEDLKKLIEECHKRNVIVILDLAINHTSTSSLWFKEFVKARQQADEENPYYDYYTCVKASGQQVGSTYQKIQNTNQYYECNFSTDMPELNFDNPKVVTACLDVCKYYLELGIDGFRFDAVKYIYYKNDEKNIEFWNNFNSEIKKIKSDAYLVGEMWEPDTLSMKYTSTMSCFSFSGAMAEGYIASAANGSSNSINSFTKYVTNYESEVKNISNDARFTPFISNHDMDRAAGYIYQIGAPQMAANLYILTNGSPIIYYGEEIMMKGSRGGSQTDANRRLAMLWGDGDTVSDPNGATYSIDKQINGTVKSQLRDSNSILNYYSKVIAFRNKYPCIINGEFSQLNIGNKYVGGFEIKYDSSNYALIHNTDSVEAIIELSSIGEGKYQSLIDYIGLGQAKIEGNNLIIPAKTSVLLK